MQSKLPYFFEIMVTFVVGGCLLSPFASAAALLVICAAKLGERYFTRNIADADRLDIQTLKTDYTKIKTKVDQIDLAKAFGRG